MTRSRDPIKRRDDGSRELQDVVDWEPESRLDRAIYRLYTASNAVASAALVVAGLFVLVALFAVGSLDGLSDPLVVAFVVLSAVPALLLAAYVRYADVTARAPLSLLAPTFVLGLLFAGFAGIVNGLAVPRLTSGLSSIGLAEVVATSLAFLVVVAPVEEAVKLLAVRIYAYRTPAFDAVIAGAVYGAAAGLGFATIENALYITQATESAAGFGSTLARGGSITTQRALAGPGHVIYSAFAGYYLGLAKFNRAYAGPIVLKGLFIAVFLHGGYNVLLTTVPPQLTDLVGFSNFAAVVTLVIAYDGIFVGVLIRKLSRYRAAYRDVYADSEPIPSERTEFE